MSDADGLSLVLQTRCAACGHALERLTSTPLDLPPGDPNVPPSPGCVTVDNRRASPLRVFVGVELHQALASAGLTMNVTVAEDGGLSLDCREAAS